MIRLAAVCLCANMLYAQSSVQGKVTDSVDHRPVAGAVVVLQGAADAYMAETDHEGRFHIDGVLPGPYQAKPQREGFTLRSPVRLTIEAGAAPPDLDLRLTPLGAISGRVVDADGDPLSSIRVEALRYTYANGKKHLETAGRARTNDRGEYAIFDLAPGRYYLKASDSLRYVWASNLMILGNKPPQAYSPIWFPDASDAETAAPLVVAAGAELRNTSIRLRTERT